MDLTTPYRGQWKVFKTAVEESFRAGYPKTLTLAIVAVQLPFVLLAFVTAPFTYVFTCALDRKLLTADEYARSWI